MGKTTRKRYSADFKAKVALDALRGELTTAQLTAKHGVHQTLISIWKKQATAGLSTVFETKPEGDNKIREGSESTDPSGQSGNAIIVTPISDPVIRFDGININNGTSAAIHSITLRLPQFGLSDPRRTQLGFIDDANTFGFDDSNNAFFVRFLDPLGTYTGDYTPFVGRPIYSTLHFYQGQGNAILDVLAGGKFSYSAAYPNTAGSLAFYADTVGGTSGGSAPNPTQFNTPGNPGGGIQVLGTAPEASCVALVLVGLLPLGIFLRRSNGVTRVLLRFFVGRPV